MGPQIEDISSEKIQKKITQLHLLHARTRWASVLTHVGGFACSCWVVYRAFTTHGFWIALLAFIALSIVYRFGVSPMFAVAASELYFGFKVVGIWLPIISYALAVITLYVDWKAYNLKRRIDPLNLGSIHD